MKNFNQRIFYGICGLVLICNGYVYFKMYQPEPHNNELQILCENVSNRHHNFSESEILYAHDSLQRYLKTLGYPRNVRAIDKIKTEYPEIFYKYPDLLNIVPNSAKSEYLQKKENLKDFDIEMQKKLEHFFTGWMVEQDLKNRPS